MANFPNIQPYTVEPVDPIQPNPPIQEQPVYDPAALQTTTYYEPTQYDQNFQYTETPRRKFPVVPALLGLAVLGIGGFAILALSSRDSNKTPTTTNTNRNVVLQWWGVFMDPEVVQPLIEEYQEANSNVTIEYANKWSNGNFVQASDTYRTELNRVLVNNDPVELPDIFMVHNTWAGDYETRSQPSSVYDFTTFSNTFYPAAVNDFAKSGTVYGVPMWMDTLAIIYNKDLLADADLTEPPTSWPRFKTVAEALTKRNGSKIEQSGFASGQTTNFSFYFELVNLLLFQNGVTVQDAQGNPIFSTNPKAVEAVRFFKSFSDSNSSWDATLKNDSALFLEEKLVMTIATSWRLREILKFNESADININLGVSQIPQLEGQSQEVINWADYWGNMVTKNRPYTVEAWQFLEWLNEPEQLQKLSQNIENKEGHFGMLYARKDMQDELQEDEYLRVYNQSLPFAQTWYMVKGDDVKALFKEMLDKSSTTNASGLADLEKKIKELLLLKGVLQ